jgi:hypothetical protein
VGSSEREIALAQAFLDGAGLSQYPDFLIDATGRHRLFSRLLIRAALGRPHLKIHYRLVLF